MECPGAWTSIRRLVADGPRHRYIERRSYVAPGLVDKLNTLVVQAVDSGEFYDGLTHIYTVASVGNHTVQLEDYPSLSCPGTSAKILVQDAEDYIRFKPGISENDGNIYVTLGAVHWQAHGEYSRISGWIVNSTPAAALPDTSIYEIPWWVKIVWPNQ